MPSSLMARLQALKVDDSSNGAAASKPTHKVSSSPPMSSLALAAKSSSLASSSRQSAAPSLHTAKHYDNHSNTSIATVVSNDEPPNLVAAKPATKPIAAESKNHSLAPHATETSATANEETGEQTTQPIETTLRRLLKTSIGPSTIPKEYTMCSSSEANDRQQHLELSPFECLPSSLANSESISTTGGHGREMSRVNSMGGRRQNKASRSRPRHDPRLVVKKYRRSAAGGGTLSEESARHPRSLEELNATVDYLLDWIFACQCAPSVDGSEENGDPNEIAIWGDDETNNATQSALANRHSLSETVNFIDDRLRAVQKDLVTLLGNFDQPQQTEKEQVSKPQVAQEMQDRWSKPDRWSKSVENAELPDRWSKPAQPVQPDRWSKSPTTTAPKTGELSSSAKTKSNPKLERALQLQALKSTVRCMQSRMIRYNILVLYLLNDLPKDKYEGKFGARALRTALTTYFNLSATIRDEYDKLLQLDSSNSMKNEYEEEVQTQDEILAYMALLHASGVIRSEETALPMPSGTEAAVALMEDAGSGWGAILSSYQKFVGKSAVMAAQYPRLTWALDLASLVQEGNYQRYFRLMRNGPVALAQLNDQKQSTHATFTILARCCAVQSLQIVRLNQLRRYNQSFGKAEKVSGLDLARLLRFDDTCAALRFCDDAGLPLVEKDGEKYVTMKAGPIKIVDESIERMCIPGRGCDVFVFGSSLDCGSNEVENNVTVARWEDATVDVSVGVSRIDGDKVVIPSVEILRNLT